MRGSHSRHGPRAKARGSLSFLVLLAASTFASAGEVTVDGGECAPAVHVVARAAPLSDVLARLARDLGFKLVFSSSRDPVIDLDATLSAREIATRLAPDENLVVAFAQNPRCPERERIVGIWVLSNGSPAPRATISREASERARTAQAGIDMVLRAHGVPPAENTQGEEN